MFSPDYFITDGEMFYAELKIHDDLVKFKVENKPVHIETSALKRGVVEAMAGDSIYYDFTGIENKSNVPLEEFYWHDDLPTEAVRLEKIWTGVWSERVKMELQIKTNLKPGYRTVKKGLLSTVNNEIDCSRSALGLAANEYVTEDVYCEGWLRKPPTLHRQPVHLWQNARHKSVEGGGRTSTAKRRRLGALPPYTRRETRSGALSLDHHYQVAKGRRKRVLMSLIDYTRVGDYLLPNIRLNEPSSELVAPLGRYARMRRAFLRDHHPITYNTLLLSEQLFPYLRDVDEIANERKARGVSEEIILSELVYE